jgi:hypothetical protein
MIAIIFNQLRNKSSVRFSVIKNRAGQSLLTFAPLLIKTLSVVGTIAMFMLGGGILLHGIPEAENYIHHISENINASLITAVFPSLVGTLVSLKDKASLILTVDFPIRA